MEIKRDRYLEKIISYMWDGQVKVITGNTPLRQIISSRYTVQKISA